MNFDSFLSGSALTVTFKILLCVAIPIVTAYVLLGITAFLMSLTNPKIETPAPRAARAPVAKRPRNGASAAAGLKSLGKRPAAA